MGRGFNQNAFTDKKEFPTTRVINGISESHPILLLRTNGHVGVTNDLGLTLAGVDRNTIVRGGCFDRYDNETPTGSYRRLPLNDFKNRFPSSGQSRI